MAMRGQHVQDGSVIERRLRPIYDWLDHGNNKKALQEADKVLKKSSNLRAAKALKALALLRLGRKQETDAILDALVEEKPCDDTTLQAMTISFRESYEYEKICKIYETAVKLDPQNEELHTHLFMSYVRIGDFKAQQQAAMSLYKFSPKNPYYFWAVMSIILQVNDTQDEMKRRVLLTLAQRMIDKFVSENKIEAQQEIAVYIMVLELQNKHEDILKFMETPLYNELVPGSLPQAQLKHLAELKRWREVNLLTKDLLWDNLDRWDYYVPYFKSSFELSNNTEDTCNGDLSESPVKHFSYDDTPEKCHEFLCQLIENIPRDKTMRGPYLARLELYKRMLEFEKDPVVLMGGSVEICLEYLRIFGSKACCASDLKSYIDMISPDERCRRVDEFLNVFYNENQVPDNLQDIQREITSICVWRYSGGCKDMKTWAEILRSRYLQGVKAGHSTNTPTEFNALDRYAMLAAHMYYDLASVTQNPLPLYDALNLLEFGLSKSPSNFHFKILCIKFYHMLGNGRAAKTVWRTLDVKHIQLSSLGWLHPGLLPGGALHTQARTSASHAARLHTFMARDSVEQLTYSYKYGTLDKLIELMELRARLEGCVHCLMCRREYILLHTIMEGSNSSVAQPSPLPYVKQLSDNRDLQVVQDWDPPSTKNQKIAEETFDHEKTYLILKDSLVNALDSCLEIAEYSKTSDERGLSMSLDNLDKNVKCFEDTFVEFKNSSGCYKSWWNIAAPFPCRIIAFVNSPVPYRDLYSQIFSLQRCVARRKSVDVSNVAESLATLLQSANDVFVTLFQGRDASVLWTSHDNVQDLSFYLEYISIACSVLGLCTEMRSKAKNKKKSHNKLSPEDDNIISTLTNLTKQTLLCVLCMEDVVEKWAEPSLPTDLVEEFSKLSFEKNENTVEDKLKYGFKEMTSGVKDILKSKTKHLKNLF